MIVALLVILMILQAGHATRYVFGCARAAGVPSDKGNVEPADRDINASIKTPTKASGT